MHRANISEVISQSQGHTIGIRKQQHEACSGFPGHWILKMRFGSACRCALKTDHNQEVKIIKEDFIEQDILKL